MPPKKNEIMLNIALDKELASAFKLKCETEGRKIKFVVAQMIKIYLEQ